MRTKTSTASGATASGDITVCVKLPNGQIETYQLEPTANIGAVCRMVSETQGISESRVNLKYSGKTLNKTASLAYLGVREETVLKVQIIEIKRITVNVKCPEDKEIEVSVENISSLRHITDAIELQLSIPADKQILKLRERVLSNMNERCVDAGITDMCTLCMQIKPSPEKSTGACSEQSYPEPAFDKEAILNSFDVSEGKNIEVAFSFDTTGSMYPCLEQVRTKLRNTVTRLIEEIPRMRIALIAHGDYCDYNSAYVTKTLDFTNDVTALVHFAQTVKKTGGGDSPECYEWVLREASQLDWSEDSAKALVVIGDEVPHPPSVTDQHVFWKHEMQLLKANGIKIYGVRALNNISAKPFYEMLSEYTAGAYIEFANFNVITEMFLAVCYKMAGEEQYNDFCEEMEQAVSQGHVTSDTIKVLQQINKTSENENVASKHDEIPDRWNIGAKWWNPDNYADTQPEYSYDSKTRKWSLYYRKHVENKSYVPGAYVPPSEIKIKTSTTKSAQKSRKHVCRLM